MTVSNRSFDGALQIRELSRRLNLRSIIGMFLVVLLFRVCFGLLAVAVSAQPSTPASAGQVGTASMSLWLQRVVVTPWMHYDAGFYSEIAESGYRLDDNSTSFHPLYPLLTAFVALLLGGNVNLALLVVSTCACTALCVLLARYVERFYGAEYAQQSIWLLLIAPPGFILLAPYTEGLFLVFAVASLFAMRVERWWLAGLLGGLASLTRQQGLALALPLAWGLWSAVRHQRARIWDGLAVLMVPFGYGLFVLYRALALGDLHSLAQAHDPIEMLRRLLVSYVPGKTIAGQHIGWPWELLYVQVHLILTLPYTLHLVIDLVLGWLWILVILLGLKSMNVLERCYSLAIVGLALCYYNGDIDPYMSLPRHIMLAFPMYIVLAKQFYRSRRWRLPAITFLVLVHLFIAFLYFIEGWIP